MSADAARGSRISGQRVAWTPPKNEEAEKSLLGALLLHQKPGLVDTMRGWGVCPEAFWWPKYGLMFAGMEVLAKRGAGLDAVTVPSAAVKAAQIAGQRAEPPLWARERVSKGEVELMEGWSPADGHVREYALIVVEAFEMRCFRELLLRGLEATDRQDRPALDEVRKLLAPAAPVARRAQSGRRDILRLVNGDGELLAQEERCPSCQEKDDELAAVKRSLRGAQLECANLKRDADAEARADGLWVTFMALFGKWQKLSGHAKTPATAERFRLVLPYLKKPGGWKRCERAIDGNHHDPGVGKMRRNKTRQVYDKWEDIFRSAYWVNEYADRAPLDWQSSLNLEGQQAQAKPDARRKRQAQPSLMAVGA